MAQKDWANFKKSFSNPFAMQRRAEMFKLMPLQNKEISCTELYETQNVNLFWYLPSALHPADIQNRE
jgi:hypothetical protein